MSNSSGKELRSPFFSRAYGGYTKGQEEFFRELLGNPKGKAVLDPMAGQAFALSGLARSGARVWVGDVDPAPLLLAALRDPLLLQDSHEYIVWFRDVLRRLARKRTRKGGGVRFVADWVSPEISDDLRRLADLCDFGLFSNPFRPGNTIWKSGNHSRFAAAITVLAARELACYRRTDNVTWLKPGGLARHARAVDPLRRTLSLWEEYASSTTPRLTEPAGSISPRLIDLATGDFDDVPAPSWIITSPPYANRLDYTRLWGPELNVLAHLCSGSPDGIKAAQIGSTVVEGTTDDPERLLQIPASIRKVLEDIRGDQAEYSASYYYPFFRNYAFTMYSALIAMAGKLRKGGTMVVFVRDTTRKDVLFPTGSFVREVLSSDNCGLEEVAVEKRIIRGHIGYLRKGSANGVYGLAQQEWWIAFRKKRKLRTREGR